jgi:N-acyl-D-amino-acid deacylase
MLKVIRNGRIIDPKNKVDSVNDLYFDEDGIIGMTLDGTDFMSEKPQVEYDASGMIVSPGFIDIHMHEDPVANGEIANNIFLTMLQMGVTSVVGGNCGLNAYDPGEYLNIVDKDGAPVNIALLAGHGYARNSQDIYEKYNPLNEAQLEKVVTSLRKSLDAGCFGISYGIKYVPGLNHKELIETARLCINDNKLLAAHIRNDTEESLEALEEFAGIAIETGLPIQVSHIGSMAGFGQMERFLKMVDEYKLSGLEISCDCYPYDAFSTEIGATTYDGDFSKRYKKDYSAIEICEGKYKGQRATPEIFKELRREAPGTLTVAHVMDKEDVKLALMHPNVMIASDGLLSGQAGHPRAAGTFPRFISKYLKKNKISLSEGLGKITSDPANKLGLDKRGNFSKGSAADITVFDLEKIDDKASFGSPVSKPEGIKYVFINGNLALNSHEIVSCNSGKALRKKAK